MKLVFVDESGDDKHKEYFGLCVAVIDAAHYQTLKLGFHAILERYGWDPDIEFKGQYLFSASKGDKSVGCDTRVAMCSEILDLTSAESNSRAKFYYLATNSWSTEKETYLSLLSDALTKALPKVSKGGHKSLVQIACDNRQDISIRQLRNVVLPCLEKKRLVLCEDVLQASSNYYTVGVLLADIVAYLAARIETIATDDQLFENISEEEMENNHKLRKLRQSSELINKVKKIEWRRV
jgi:hypothetical protein